MASLKEGLERIAQMDDAWRLNPSPADCRRILALLAAAKALDEHGYGYTAPRAAILRAAIADIEEES